MDRTNGGADIYTPTYVNRLSLLRTACKPMYIGEEANLTQQGCIWQILEGRVSAKAIVSKQSVRVGTGRG
jgi:hypothetical protein